MPQLYFFTGDHRQALQEKLRFWMTEFEKKHSSSNLESYSDISEKSLSGIISALETAPFLSDKRMIVIQSFPFSADEEKSFETESLEKALLEIPETSVVIFVSPHPDKRGRFYKFLKKHARLEPFDLPKGRDLQHWLSKKIHQQGKTIDQNALQLLLLFCGENVDHLSAELSKLFLLKNTVITEHDIRKYVSPNPEAKIFHALDLVGTGSRFQVLRAFEQLFQGAEEIMMIFYMIVRQFRYLIQVRSLLDKETSKPVIQKRLHLAPFQAVMLLKQAERFSLSQLKNAYHVLSQIDFRIKTGALPSSTQNPELLRLTLNKFLCSLYE